MRKLFLAALLSLSVILMGANVASARAPEVAARPHAVGAALPVAPEPTPEQLAWIEEQLRAAGVTEAMVRPPASVGGHPTAVRPVVLPAVLAVVVAAAARCAVGALVSIPEQALIDISKGKASGYRAYVENAVAACFIGAVGGWVWKLISPRIKKEAIAIVVSTIIRFGWR